MYMKGRRRAWCSNTKLTIIINYHPLTRAIRLEGYRFGGIVIKHTCINRRTIVKSNTSVTNTLEFQICAGIIFDNSINKTTIWSRNIAISGINMKTCTWYCCTNPDITHIEACGFLHRHIWGSIILKDQIIAGIHIIIPVFTGCCRL